MSKRKADGAASRDTELERRERLHRRLMVLTLTARAHMDAQSRRACSLVSRESSALACNHARGVRIRWSSALDTSGRLPDALVRGLQRRSLRLARAFLVVGNASSRLALSEVTIALRCLAKSRNVEELHLDFELPHMGDSLNVSCRSLAEALRTVKRLPLKRLAVGANTNWSDQTYGYERPSTGIRRHESTGVHALVAAMPKCEALTSLDLASTFLRADSTAHIAAAIRGHVSQRERAPSQAKHTLPAPARTHVAHSFVPPPRVLWLV